MKIKFTTYILTALMFVLAAGLQASAADVHTRFEQQSVTSETSSVRIVAGHVELSANGSQPANFAIYAITGQLVKTVMVPPGTSVTVDLPKGIYVVRGDNWAKQIVVR